MNYFVFIYPISYVFSYIYISHVLLCFALRGKQILRVQFELQYNWKFYCMLLFLFCLFFGMTFFGMWHSGCKLKSFANVRILVTVSLLPPWLLFLQCNAIGFPLLFKNKTAELCVPTDSLLLEKTDGALYR